MVENCWGGSGYSAETQGRLGFKGLRLQYDVSENIQSANLMSMVFVCVISYGIWISVYCNNGVF